MAAGARAENLQGECLRGLDTAGIGGGVPDACAPFRRFSIHTRFASPFTPTFDAGTFSCGVYGPGGAAGTQEVPYTSIPLAIASGGALYGRSNETAIPDVYFNSADLTPWRQRLLTTMFPSKKASGPPLSKFHMVIPVSRRNKGSAGNHNGNYNNRNSFYFTDADSSINGQSDWMGPIHPAGYFWTNSGLTQPFMAVDYYEQTGQSPPAFNLNQWVVPFCNQIPFRNSAGTIIGHFVGYTAIHYFALGFIHFAEATKKTCNEDGTYTEEKVFLPNDYRDLTPPIAKVKSNNQFFMLDSHFYMVAQGVGGGPTVKSPKIASARWWHYGDPNSNPWSCNPYFYVTNAPAGSWEFDLNFNIVGGTTEAIKFGLSMTETYIAP